MFSALARIFIALFVMLAAGAARAETLQKLLAESDIPVQGFTTAELASEVNAAIGSDAARSVVAVRKVIDGRFDRSLIIVGIDKRSRESARRELADDENHVCSGSPLDVAFVDEFVLVSIHINPSAECTLVLDKSLQLRKTLYGFTAVRIAEAQIVLVENMIHFAAQHPERLQWNDLRNGESAEIYPIKGDPLRKNLTEKNRQGIPSQAICAEMNDPCQPDLFDESLDNVSSNGDGKVAFIARQTPAHAVNAGEPPVEIASQSVLYVVQHTKNGWSYCQEELNDAEKAQVAQDLKSNFDRAASRCHPSLPLEPDMSTAVQNPFSNR